MTPGSAGRCVSVVRQVTDCAMWPGRIIVLSNESAHNIYLRTERTFTALTCPEALESRMHTVNVLKF